MGTWRASRARGVTDLEQLALTAALRPGGDGLTAVYQPVVALHDHLPVGYQGSIRGRHLGRVLAPAVLFGAARAAGRLAELDRAALATVVREAAPWITGRSLSVRLLPGSFDPERIRELDRACHILGLSTDRLVLEVAASGPGAATGVGRMIEAAREHGARLALHDARPDHRTLERLRHWRPDLIKVSMVVTHQLPASREQLARLVGAAREHGAAAVLEGVETAEQERAARDVGIELVQGYRYGAPLAPHELDTVTLAPTAEAS